MNIGTSVNNIPIQTSSLPTMAAKHKKTNNAQSIQKDSVELTGNSGEKLINADDMAKASRGSMLKSAGTFLKDAACTLLENTAKLTLAVGAGGLLGAGLGALMSTAPYVGGLAGSLIGVGVGSGLLANSESGTGALVGAGVGIAAALKATALASTMSMAAASGDGAMVGATIAAGLFLLC
jgi:hypothetical protein